MEQESYSPISVLLSLFMVLGNVLVGYDTVLN